MTHTWTRIALVGAAASALAACATTPSYPTQPGQQPVQREMPTPNFPIIQPPPPGEPPAPTARPTETIGAQPLAPPPGAVESAPLAPLAEPDVPPPPPPPPETRTRTVTSVSGKVVDASGKPQTYEVQSGDGLDSIARKLGTTRKQLAADNNLEEPYRIRPGQKLKGPETKAKAYVVGSGDTLYAIARRFNVKAAEIAEANNMAVDDPIRSGQKLVLPKGFKDSGPVTRTVTETVAAPAPQPRPQPALRPSIPATPPPVASPITPAVPAPVVAQPRPPASQPAAPAAPAAPIISTGAVPTDSEVAAAGRGRFLWPVKGEVISGFGPKGVGQRNDGLNIKAGAGTTVQSAASGEVVYAGDQVPGFGNLVLVKHEGGWVTAYAHLSRVDVKMRQAVTQGQQLGQVGSTGGVSEPQLHFEVRYSPSPKDKARPIDPALVLPR